MRLSDNSFKAAYNKSDDNIADEFYLPCMRASSNYDRVSGYFGSTIYIIAWDALKEFILNNGKMRLICSPLISDEDKAAMAKGYSARNDEALSESLRKEVEELFSSPALSAPATLLAYLVSAGIIDIKIAAVGDESDSNVRRLFHDKVGVFEDVDGSAVGFRGSMNETFKGLSSDGNIESIDVFPNWMDERDKERVVDAEEQFKRLWSNSVPGVIIYDFPSAIKSVLREKAKGSNWEQLLDEIKVTEHAADRWKPSNKLGSKVPRPHQVNALNAWVANGRRGIFEHATGSGKTFTAICAIKDALMHNEVVLILVPSCDLLSQWYKELKNTLADIDVYYLLCGDENTKWKKSNTLASWTSPAVGKHRIIISTMDTACTDRFQHGISQGNHIFLVADEMHRLGSEKRRHVLNLSTGARLGLSATPRRYGDAEGTAILFDYFGGIIPPPYTLQDAINAHVLTRYFYHPQKLQLTRGEQKDWNTVTCEIGKIIARNAGKGVDKKDIFGNLTLKRLLIQRARIVKNASNKVPLAIQVLKEHFQPGQKWIVYCDNITQLNNVLREAIAAGFDAYEYYSEMRGDRETTLSYFDANGGVLVSIKCLDEGVDIPSTTHALILASSQNPREFIQRRGRILRTAPGKLFAHLYDAITVPQVSENENDKSLSIIMAELSRAIEFGGSAENPACITDLKNIAIDFQVDYNNIKDGGIEEDEE